MQQNEQERLREQWSHFDRPPPVDPPRETRFTLRLNLGKDSRMSNRAPRQEWVTFALLAPLLLALALFAATRPWHSVPGVDERTYTEMVLGVAKHGLPYT